MDKRKSVLTHHAQLRDDLSREIIKERLTDILRDPYLFEGAFIERAAERILMAIICPHCGERI